MLNNEGKAKSKLWHPMTGFERVAVSAKVNSVRNDGLEIIEPANSADAAPAQAALF